MRGFGIVWIVVLVAVLCAVPAGADDEKPASKSLTAKDIVDLGHGLRPSLCQVEVTLRYDKGEAPHGLSTSEYSEFDSTIADHRPIRIAGFLLSQEQVLVRDLELESRFIETIEVVQGETRVGASICGHAQSHDASYLKLDAPIEGAVPFVFDADAKGPYVAAWYGESDADWVITIASTLSRITIRRNDAIAQAWSESVILTKDGTPIGISTEGELDVAGSWKGSPLEWKRHDVATIESLEASTKAISNRALLPVKLRFRSPKANASGNPWESMFGDDEGDTETERDAVGVLVSDTDLLILERLDAKTTARLESIEVRPPDREPVVATFVASLKDYGAIVARMNDPLPGALHISERPIREFMYGLLLGAHIRVHGDQRDLHVGHYRFGAVSRSWRDQVMPSFDGPSAGYYVFDTNGALVAVPVVRRRPGQTEEWDREGVSTLPAAYLLPVLADLPANSDPNNVPVKAADEGRIAWFGVEVQKLDRELARVNEVSHLTQDGESGALVSFVYPGSPAASGGIEPGVILLRIHDPERPQPIAIGGGDDYGFDMLAQLQGSLPEEMWGAVSGIQPWGSANNWINRTLTEIGFGKPFTLEYFSNGTVHKQAFVVEKGPAHFEAAPQHKSEALGITVKDLTYEARRYFQLAPDAPGVIVAKTESGEPAAVAGIKPFEIVTEIGGEPVTDAQGFEAAIGGGGELQFKIKNRLRERVVKLKPADGDD